MSSANPLWGSPRIVGEPRNHVKDLASIDFFLVPTVQFQLLFVFLVLATDRRRIVHFNVTEHPSAEWTTQQVVQAFPWDDTPPLPAARP
jgi:hypothetical protein